MAGSVRCEEQRKLRNLIRRTGLAARKRNLALRKLDRNLHTLQITLLGVVTDLGIDSARTDDVNSDTGRRKLQRQHLGHGYLGRLGARVGRGAGVAEDACTVYGGGDDHGAAPSLQVRNGVLDRVERAAQVRAERPVPVLRRELLDRRPYAVNARVCEYHIEPAEPIRQRGDRPLHLIRLRDVGSQWNGLTARLLYLASRLL